MKAQLGLIAKWSSHFGFTAVYDPTLGEWWDIATKDAPDWAKRECFKRRELYKAGNKRAYWLTREDMEEIWEKEKKEMPEFSPAISEKGIYYEDYADEVEEKA